MLSLTLPLILALPLSLASALIGELYQQFRDEDGFIYIMYSGENTFG